MYSNIPSLISCNYRKCFPLEELRIPHQVTRVFVRPKPIVVLFKNSILAHNRIYIRQKQNWFIYVSINNFNYQEVQSFYIKHVLFMTWKKRSLIPLQPLLGGFIFLYILYFYFSNNIVHTKNYNIFNVDIFLKLAIYYVCVDFIV